MRKNRLIIILFLVLSLFVSVVSFNLNKVEAASSSYYSSDIDSLSGNALKTSLRTLITNTHTYKSTYEDCKDPAIVKKTDGDPNNSGNIILFWSELSISSAWDSGKSWNREHVWPQSQSGGLYGESGAGADLHHIRPVDPDVNSSHSNNPYGIVSGDHYVDTSSTNGSVLTQAKCKGGLFEPSDSKKGDTARIIFYLLVRYSALDGLVNNVASSMDLLLEWNNSDPVDASETRRNDAVQEIQGNRNPFIDNSNYANLIWDPDNASTGGNTGGGTTGGDNTGGDNTGGDNTGNDTEEVVPENGQVATFEFGADNSSVTSEQDGTSASSYTENSNGYTLTLSNLAKVYKNSYDAKGNACLKLGSSSAVGGFSFTVPDKILKVVFKVARYKSNTAMISINGVNKTISTFSSNGEYTDVVVDTSTEKTVTFTTISSNPRCKITSIAYYVESSDPEEVAKNESLKQLQASSTKTSLMLSYNYEGSSVQTNYAYTFTSKQYTSNGEKTLGDITWTLAGNGNYWGYDSTKGQQFGSGSYPYTTMTLTSGSLSNVTSIKINTSGASSVAGTLTVLVGGNQVGEAVILTKEATEYTFTPTTALNGSVQFSYTQTSSKAIYIKSIEIVCSIDNIEYSLNSASLRFGSYITKDIYDTLNKEGTVWGVEYTTGNVTDWSKVNAKTVICTPAQVATPDADVVDPNGEYYQFALVVKGLNYSHLDTTISARVFVEYEGVRYYMSSASQSLRSVANVYLSSPNATFEEHIGILEHLSTYGE